MAQQNPPSQLEMFAVPSPCIDVCQSGPTGFCLGCFRSREERLYWNKIDDATKRTIIKACQRRKKLALARKNKKDMHSSDEPGQGQQSLF
jgi:predicted Fe-S protein YdhL (DUF1289 family)